MERKKSLISCVNANEVYEILTENGVKISEADAEKIYALLHTEKLEDNSVESVSGGRAQLPDYDGAPYSFSP